ncbi:MAG TPA: CU044_5270 family protein [Baekduia sp.]
MNDESPEIPFLITLGEQLAERAERDEEAVARGSRFRRPRRGGARTELRARRRVLAFGGGRAAGLVAVLLALTVSFGGGDGGGRVVAPTPATAQAVLLDLARAARSQPDGMPGPEQYFFVRSLTTRLQSGRPPTARNTSVVTYDRRLWTSPTAPGRLYETPITTQPLLGGKVTQMRSPQAPQRLPELDGYRVGHVKLTRGELLTFPASPRAIVARMRKAAPRATTAQLFDGITGSLREQPAPPALRAALLKALADLPGVRLIGATKDPRGRRAVAIGLQGDGGTRTELFLDPKTSDLLAEREVLTDPDAHEHSPLPAGTTLSSTVYLRRAPVDSVADQ